MNRPTCWTSFALIAFASSVIAAEFRSHPPMRALPKPSSRPLSDGPARFVDPMKGADSNAGTQAQPWRTAAHGVGRLQPGETLYLRGGVYFESLIVSLGGTKEKPITIRAYPGELAILDGGLREFQEDPATAWEPAPQGVEGEYRSTKAYQQGGGFGQFADSMIPFHRYLTMADLRSSNELYRQELNNRSDDPIGIYCGPGTRRDRETGRIHIRLAPTKLAGLGNRAYRGETDPRKLPLVIAGHDYTLRIEGARHVRIQDLVVRGGERAAVLVTRDQEDISQDAEDIELDGLTLYGSGSALRAGQAKRLRVVNCALRGHTAPWHSRFTVKNRAGAGYLIMAEGSDFEIAHCELTDHHDCITFHGLDGLRFHHNRVDNFDDDGIEPGPKKERGRTYIYQNHISRVLNPFTAHANQPIPVPHEQGSGVYVYRNVIDLRQGTYKAPPKEPDPSGAYLNEPTQLVCHNHGSPTIAVYYVYHNTFLMHSGAFRNYYGFTWGSSTRGTTRRVFNNIFLQIDGLPGLNFAGTTAEDDFQADGNLLWSVLQGPSQTGDFFSKFRQSPQFTASKKAYPPGWGASDVFASPRLVSLGGDEDPVDFRLQPKSPAIDAGVAIPADWPDPLRDSDAGKPDLGAFPSGAQPLVVGPSPVASHASPKQGLLPHGLNAPRIVVGRTVDDRVDRSLDHRLGRIALQQGQQLDGILDLRIEPAVVRLRRQDHGHPVVQRTHQLVGVGGEQRTRLDHFAFAAPPFPQARDGEESAVAESDVMRQLLFSERFPLEETIGGHQAAAPAKGLAESRLFGRRLRASVDHPAADGRVVGPTGDQPPFDHGQLPRVAFVGQSHDGDRLRWGDVVPRGQLGIDQRQMELLDQL